MHPLARLIAAADGDRAGWREFVSRLAPDARILWYPAAGDDLRDMVFLHPAGLAHLGWAVDEIPDLFIHTDYNLGMWGPWLEYETPGRILKDRLARTGTEIEITAKTELRFSPDIDFFVDPHFIAFPQMASPIPQGLFLRLRIRSKVVREPYECAMLYLFFENANFCEQFTVKGGVRFSHIVKIREGTGFGGGRQSIASIYDFLGFLGTRWLFCDTPAPSSLTESMFRKTVLSKENTPVLLEQVGSIRNWSGLPGGVFRVFSQPLDAGETILDRGHRIRENLNRPR